MIRYDTFRFDYDTNNYMVCGRALVLLLVPYALCVFRRYFPPIPGS
jgi:hypothetical protein